MENKCKTWKWENFFLLFEFRNKNPRGGERQFENKPMRPKTDSAGSEPIVNKGANIGINNKFSKLAVDVEDAEEIYEDSTHEQEE